MAQPQPWSLQNSDFVRVTENIIQQVSEIFHELYFTNNQYLLTLPLVRHTSIIKFHYTCITSILILCLTLAPPLPPAMLVIQIQAPNPDLPK